jgi:UDP-N-acetylglucosamine:LPS N-acetylglucosamine transferase
MQDVPKEAVEARGAAGAVPQPVKAPRKTVKQIREAKAEAVRLTLMADKLLQAGSGGEAAMVITPERTAQAQR